MRWSRVRSRTEAPLILWNIWRYINLFYLFTYLLTYLLTGTDSTVSLPETVETDLYGLGARTDVERFSFIEVRLPYSKTSTSKSPNLE